MNRFLTKRRAKEAEGSSVPPMPLTSGATKKKKGKKGQQEVKPELDLRGALPSSDDFRTSLIMPTLSTRFSMLREQDDPNSKLGKASDDSVLQPKRQSRFGDFGFAPGLSDIAEVSSINSSIRPPFAYGRQGSQDEYGTDDDGSSPGSIMSRARPGEGNVLFGGRQKIYKIPASGSSRNLGAGMGGRALYDDDVSVSAFQQFKKQEREAQEAEEAERNAQYSSVARGGRRSPSFEEKKRETSSSTNSGPSNTRSSTAATSIASQGTNSVSALSPALPPTTSALEKMEKQPLDRSTTKAHRLYEQGLDQHMQEQQYSALNRLNSIQKPRTINGKIVPPYLQQQRSTSNLHDRFNRPGDNTTSPPPSAPLTNVGRFGPSVDIHSSNSSPKLGFHQSPPMSPIGSDDESPLSSALQPNDRGKATAMGAFNKPAKAFDEQQYLQRQMTLHKGRDQGRETPPPRRDSPAKAWQPKASFERGRADSTSTTRSRSASTSRQPPNAFSVFQRAANQMQNNSPSYAQRHESPRRPAAESPRRRPAEAQGTFFASPGSSDEEEPVAPAPLKTSELDRRIQAVQRSQAASPVPPPMHDHPALRSQNSRLNMSRTEEHSGAPSANDAAKSDGPDIDSPTLGDGNGGLSGLVRQHLRSTSNVSSVYDDPPPDPMPQIDTRQGPRGRTSESDTPAHSSYSHSNPWDLEDFEGGYYGEADSFSSQSPVDGNRSKNGSFGHGPSKNIDPRRQVLMRESENKPVAPWEEELKKSGHQRMASTETQREREDFANELAQRQKAIQESLKQKVEDPSRSREPSPAPAASGGLKAWGGMLRTKSSRDSFAAPSRQQDPPTKAMKMLGLGAPSTNASTTSLSQSSDRFYKNDYWRSEDSRIGQQDRDPVLQMKSSRFAEARSQFQPRGPSEESSRGVNKGSSPPESSKSSMRNRSSSDFSSGRSRSRTGRYRDDLEKAMVEGTGTSSSPMVPALTNSAAPSPHISQDADAFAPATRLRSNSRSTAPGYFDQKSLHPIHTGPMSTSTPHLTPAGSSPGVSPGLSPRPSPGLHSPAINSGRHTPVSPYYANPTPPISNSGTPVVSFAASTSSLPTRIPTNRKKSISKHEISEPVLISSTSAIDTIDLPPGASLKNGLEDVPPPVPPINPLRRRFGFGRAETFGNDRASSPMASPSLSHANTISADEDSASSKLRGKLRKTSSEGHSLKARARQQTVTTPNQPMPMNVSPPRPVEGAMF